MRLLTCLLVCLTVVLGTALPAAADTWRFAVLSDTRGVLGGINEDALEKIALSVAADNVDLVLVPGDLVSGWALTFGAELKGWRRAMGPVYDAGIPVFPLRGNHETCVSRSAWRKHWPDLPRNGPKGEEGLTYSFEHKNAKFIGLDHYVRDHRLNQPWLDQALASNRKPHAFVFGHEPAFGPRPSNCLARYPDMRDAFWDSLGTAGVRMYLCGHEHLYARAEIADSRGNLIQQVIIGSGGAPFDSFGEYHEGRVRPLFYNNDLYGYVLVEVDGDDVRVQWRACPEKDATGPVATRDTYTYSLREGPVLARDASRQPSAGKQPIARPDRTESLR